MSNFFYHAPCTAPSSASSFGMKCGGGVPETEVEHSKHGIGESCDVRRLPRGEMVYRGHYVRS